MTDDGLVANPATVPGATHARTGKRHRIALFVVLGFVGVLPVLSRPDGSAARVIWSAEDE